MNRLIFAVKYSLVTLIFFGFTTLCNLANAQVNPATSLLLRGGSNAGAKSGDTSAYDSGRFKVAPAEPSPAPMPLPQIVAPAQKPVAPTQVTKPQPKVETQKIDQVMDSKTDQAVEKNSNLTDEVRSALMGEDDASEYMGKLHPLDSRLNIVEIEIAPTYSHVDSSSNYWFRDYNSSGPGIFVGASIWASPFVGIDVNYHTTLMSDLKQSPAEDKKMNVDFRTLEASLQFRKFFSHSRRSPSLILGIGHAENEMVAPKSSDERIGVKVSSVNIYLQSRMPTAVNEAWVFGIGLYPSQKVSEEATKVKIKSGDDYKSNGIQISLGKEYNFDRQNSFYWKLSHKLDKTIYEGTVNVQDPRSKTTPEDISVSSGSTLLQFGYRWGD